MSELNLLLAQQVASAAPQNPHWTAYATAVAVPVVALIAAWIAFQQSKIARNKLKLDLFERRLAIYEAVRNTLGTVTRNGRLTQQDEFDYLTGTRSAKWLFGEEVATYLDKTLWEKIVDFGLHNTMSSSSSDDERKIHVQKRADTMKWLIAQCDEFDKLCARYLKLKH